MAATEPVSIPRPTTRKPLMTRRGRVVVLAASCLVAATFAFAPRAHQDLPQVNPAADSQPQFAFADVELAAATLPEPRRAATTTAAASDIEPEASGETLPAPVKTDYTTVVTASAPREQDNVEAPLIVTINGCLERDAERFRLKDTAGDEAPRSRNWRSGFLRRNATIDVVDEADRHHLPTYIGQRVRLTGALVDREMQVRSVLIVAESCQESIAG